ncbi:hypothetical protein CAL20_09615 [Bordetella genomosp. 4]|uniref:Uncharacterized protein n=1 Tax=Bordetella genomosp. 4 TaxID=463044 RepID=A0A261U6R7_9BORD|nr:hypothetical protein CAL20_09615 [Bordetella genomosp. 4]
MWHCEKCLGTPGFGVGCVCPRNAQPAASAEPSDCDNLAHELDGVIADVEQGDGFDEVCLETLKRVRAALAQQGKEG